MPVAAQRLDCGGGHEAHLTGDDDSERLRADEAPSASNRIVVACSTDRHGGVRRGHLMFLPEMQQTAIAAALDRGEALRFIGIRDACFILISPTTGPISAIEAARAQAHRRLAELATRF